MNIGKSLKRSRQNRGYNQVDFAKLINIHPSYLSQIESGKKTAFVGLSGSGKSTLVNLLLRFYDNYTGNIIIDSHDIKSLSLFDSKRT